MKNKLIIHIALSIVHALCEIFLVYKLVQMNLYNELVFASFSTVMFIVYLVSWIAPKLFFSLCWKISYIMPDTFDYETGYNKMNITSLGLFVTSFIIFLIGCLIIF